MKTIYLVRHAKSSWDVPGQSDFDRALNERGKTDAPAMAKRLISKDVEIDAIVTSPAKRARKTAEIFAKEYKIKENKIILATELYNASPEDFYRVIESLDDEIKRVAIFSHNPGITDFANSMIEDVMIDNMPTCSVFAIKMKSKSWKDFRNGEKSFLFFEYPKKGQD